MTSQVKRPYTCHAYAECSICQTVDQRPRFPLALAFSENRMPSEAPPPHTATVGVPDVRADLQTPLHDPSKDATHTLPARFFHSQSADDTHAHTVRDAMQQARRWCELFRNGAAGGDAVSFMAHLEASRSTCFGRRRARPRARSATRPARRPRSRTCEGSAWKHVRHYVRHRGTRPHMT
jgi:hypothetical protein